jgi:citrate lyase beta subunit
MHESLGGASLVPLVESAAGWQALPVLSGAPGVLRLAVGHIDFMADTGLQCDSDESELAPLRFAVAMATRMHRLAPAIDGVTVQIDDEERLRRDTRRAVRFGFGGKLCIHPRQVAIVHECLAPDGRGARVGAARRRGGCERARRGGEARRAHDRRACRPAGPAHARACNQGALLATDGRTTS